MTIFRMKRPEDMYGAAAEDVSTFISHRVSHHEAASTRYEAPYISTQTLQIREAALPSDTSMNVTHWARDHHGIHQEETKTAQGEDTFMYEESRMASLSP